MKKTFVITIILLSTIIWGCTRDDICTQETLTTPLLIIEFRDINERLVPKQVENLNILVNDPDSTLVQLSITDTLVSIPLNTLSNTSQFIFTINNEDPLNQNTDIITFNYNTENIYVNRACAFRVIYNNLSVDITEETNNTNWIRDFSILNTTIEDETEAHITIFH